MCVFQVCNEFCWMGAELKYHIVDVSEQYSEKSGDYDTVFEVYILIQKYNWIVERDAIVSYKFKWWHTDTHTVLIRHISLHKKGEENKESCDNMMVPVCEVVFPWAGLTRLLQFIDHSRAEITHREDTKVYLTFSPKGRMLSNYVYRTWKGEDNFQYLYIESSPDEYPLFMNLASYTDIYVWLGWLHFSQNILTMGKNSKNMVQNALFVGVKYFGIWINQLVAFYLRLSWLAGI